MNQMTDRIRALEAEAEALRGLAFQLRDRLAKRGFTVIPFEKMLEVVGLSLSGGATVKAEDPNGGHPVERSAAVTAPCEGPELQVIRGDPDNALYFKGPHCPGCPSAPPPKGG